MHRPARNDPIPAQESAAVEGDDIGIGTERPEENLHLLKTNPATGARFLTEDTNTGVANKTRFRLRSANVPDGGDWAVEVNAAGNFMIGYLPCVNAVLVVNASETTNVTVRVFGHLVVEGTCTGCDALLSSDFPLESIQDHATEMWQKGHLPGVGPTPEGKTSIDVFDKVTGMLHELKKAHLYIEQLYQRLEAHEKESSRSCGRPWPVCGESLR